MFALREHHIGVLCGDTQQHKECVKHKTVPLVNYEGFMCQLQCWCFSRFYKSVQIQNSFSNCDSAHMLVVFKIKLDNFCPLVYL